MGTKQLALIRPLKTVVIRRGNHCPYRGSPISQSLVSRSLSHAHRRCRCPRSIRGIPPAPGQEPLPHARSIDKRHHPPPLGSSSFRRLTGQAEATELLPSRAPTHLDTRASRSSAHLRTVQDLFRARSRRPIDARCCVSVRVRLEVPPGAHQADFRLPLPTCAGAMPPRSTLTTSFSASDANNEVICPLKNHDGSNCRKRCSGVRLLRRSRGRMGVRSGLGPPVTSSLIPLLGRKNDFAPCRSISGERIRSTTSPNYRRRKRASN